MPKLCCVPSGVATTRPSHIPAARFGDELSAMAKPRLLLHVCCAPCSTQALEVLRADYAVTFYFCDPNIYPEEEFDRRLADAERFARETGTPFIAVEYDPERWCEAVKGLEDEPEHGRRCEVCIRLRLEHTADWAQQLGFEWFATTLSVSPHKNADVINRIGRDLARARDVRFLPADFKTDGGFQRSVALSKEHGLHRQDYCGCIYSLRERDERRRATRG